MKPIELRVKGLHSFRDEQTIDFLTLSQAGVFGIFGSTGSGKSSLLDAMTLALYGKVERAPKNTQGIMNHAEDSLSVSFTFELKKEIPERYKVERLYKRTKDDGMKTASCRVFKLGDPVEVLADKERDVTQFIQDLLGLTHEDFTRAVVLPQGKFSEFLTLKGTDRRKMLQRLFRLEKYGDLLNDRLRSSIARLNVRMKEIIAEQQGLGDASEEMLEKVKDEYVKAQEHLAWTKKENAKATTAYQTMKDKWQLQQELNDIHRSLEKMDGEKPVIQEKQTKLREAGKAEHVLPVLQDWEEVTTNRHGLTIAFKGKEADLLELKKGTSAAEKSMNKAKLELDEKELILSERKEKFREGLRLQKAYHDESKVLKDSQKNIQLETEKLEKEESAITSLKEDQNNISKDILEKEKDIKGLTISFEEREKVHNAFQDKKEIETGRRQLEDYRSNWKELNRNLKGIENKLSTLNQTNEEWETKGKSLYHKILNAYNHVSEHQRLLEQADGLLTGKISTKQQELKHIEEKVLSAKLVHSLKEGEACPVCGSLEHPDPAQVTDHDAEALQEELEQLRALSDHLARGTNRLDLLKDRLEHITGRLVEVTAQSAAALESGSLSDIEDKIELLETKDWKNTVHKWITEVKSSEQDVFQLQELAEQWLKEGQPLSGQMKSLEKEQAFYQEQMDQLIEKAEMQKENLANMQQKWEENYSSYDFDKLEELRNQIQGNDRKAEALTQQVRELKQKQDALVKDVEKRQSDIRSHHDLLASIKGSLEVRKTTVKTINEELDKQGLSVDSPYQTWLNELEKERHDLLTALKETEAEFSRLEKERSSLEQDVVKLQTSLQYTEKHEQKLGKQLDELMRAEGFSEKEQVRAASLSKETMNALQEAIKTFEDQLLHLNRRKAQLQEGLKDEVITQEDYEKARIHSEKMQETLEDAVKQAAGLEKVYTGLQDRAKRYRDLQSEKEALQTETDRHEELQRLFRGNVFVEFVAEEQLHQICIAASKRLGELTHARYALEVDSGGGFVIRDDANGGIKRPVSTLSGGETFLTSLALALSLSEQIQLSGDVPLQFFFLDEGFGTLDQDLLDTVVTALEKLHMNQLSIGLISHVPELQARLSKKIIVTPAEPGGKGSTVSLEVL